MSEQALEQTSIPTAVTGFSARQLGVGANAGAVAIEQERAVAEAQGKLILAKKFPRNLSAAHEELMLACEQAAFADIAFYSLPRGDKTITGPSIRLAEEIARTVGNIAYGHRELSRTEGKSEIEVYAWDMEKNNYSTRQMTVIHEIDLKEGKKRKCISHKEIEDLIANKASKQLRGRILAIVPKWLEEAAINRCQATIASMKNLPDRVKVMVGRFSKLGVTADMLTAKLGYPLEKVTSEDFVDLTGIYNSIKEGMPISQFFGVQDEKLPADNTALQAAITGAQPEQVQPTAQPQAQTQAQPQTQPQAKPQAKSTVTKKAEPPKEKPPRNQEQLSEEDMHRSSAQSAEPAEVPATNAGTSPRDIF